MANAMELVSESLKKSLDPRLWLCYLLIIFISLLVFFFVVFILLVISLAIFYIFETGIVQLILWALLALIGIILFLYVGAVVWAIMLFTAKDFLEKGKISLSDSWNSALQRAPSIFLATAIIAVFFGTLVALLILPSVVPLAETVLSSVITQEVFLNPELLVAPLMQLIFVMLGMLSLFAFISLLVSPFTILVAPTVIFENVSAFSGIKKAIVAAKENYLRNLASIILYAIVLALINAFFFLIIAGVNLMGLPFSAIEGFAIARIVLEIISYVLSAFSTIIMLSFVSVFSVNYYNANFGFTVEKTQEMKKWEKKATQQDNPQPEQSEKETSEIKLEPWMGKKI